MTPGKSNSITINVNTTGLAEGNYSAEIVIADNDPDETPKTVSVTLHVGGGGVGATATRGLPATVELGANFNVTTAASGCGFAGQVVETLPAGFAYVSCTPENIGVQVEDSVVGFTFTGDAATFAYTFNGIIKDAEMNEYAVGGDNQYSGGLGSYGLRC